MDLLHRVVFRTFNGEIPPDMEVDHINGIRTDCRLSNLRLLTPKQNCIERTLRNNRSSKYLYVSYNKEKKKWSCQITVDKVQFRVGYYETEDEAGYVSEQIQNGIYPPELLARIEAKKKTNTNG